MGRRTGGRTNEHANGRANGQTYGHANKRTSERTNVTGADFNYHTTALSWFNILLPYKKGVLLYQDCFPLMKISDNKRNGYVIR